MRLLLLFRCLHYWPIYLNHCHILLLVHLIMYQIIHPMLMILLLFQRDLLHLSIYLYHYRKVMLVHSWARILLCLRAILKCFYLLPILSFSLHIINHHLAHHFILGQPPMLHLYDYMRFHRLVLRANHCYQVGQ